MKTYEQDAKEIMARAKDARRKQKNFRMAVGGIAAGVLLFAAALGVWRAVNPREMELPSASEQATTAPDGTGAAFFDPTGAVDRLRAPLGASAVRVSVPVPFLRRGDLHRQG